MAHDDFFGFEGIIGPCKTYTSSKRGVLSVLSSIYDPLGLVSPFVLKAKIIFQSIWQLGVDWDEPLPESLAEEFQNWVSSSRSLSKIRISRAIFSDVPWRTVTQSLELHGFGDASLKGYGACVYARINTNHGYKVNLVAARCRVAPLKQVTLPRLELLGALVCARLVDYIKMALHLSNNTKVYCYIDSQVTLAWIKGDPGKLQTFVGNRVSEI